jgi:hypothetical protein
VDTELVYNDGLTAPKWALNSAVECHLHTVEVIGSNPIAPTNSTFVFSGFLKAGPRTPFRWHRTIILIIADDIVRPLVVRRLLPEVFLPVIQNPTRKFDALDLFVAEGLGSFWFEANNECAHWESVCLKGTPSKTAIALRTCFSSCSSRLFSGLKATIA